VTGPLPRAGREDLAIINGEAVNNVTVVQNRFLNANQAVTNWGGSGWGISRNFGNNRGHGLHPSVFR
jgi:hypothetical protein